MTAVAAVDAAGLDAALGSSGVVLVDFWAAWCAPCHAMQPILTELAHDERARLRVVSVDVAEHVSIGERFDIQSLPTFVYFVDGSPAARLVGARTKRQLARALHSLASVDGSA
jgi:thioredoxin 1